MRFLITNDDGFDAPGLVALFHALRELGDVDVVAPAVCHSAKGHAVDTRNHLRVESRAVEPFGTIRIVHSSPADCVRVGLCAPGSQPVDFVVAGINPGANVGVDLFYSGTAAAAREAAILRTPAIAVSRYLLPNMPVDWNRLSQHVRRVLATLISERYCLPAGQFWNVNFPAVDGDHHPDEVTFAAQGTRQHDIRFEPVESTDLMTVLRYTGSFQSRGVSKDCDVSGVFGGKIIATPVDLCTTAPNPFTPIS